MPEFSIQGKRNDIVHDIEAHHRSSLDLFNPTKSLFQKFFACGMYTISKCAIQHTHTLLLKSTQVSVTLSFFLRVFRRYPLSHLIASDFHKVKAKVYPWNGGSEMKQQLIPLIACRNRYGVATEADKFEECQSATTVMEGAL
jgi:hypothetical protein